MNVSMEMLTDDTPELIVKIEIKDDIYQRTFHNNVDYEIYEIINIMNSDYSYIINKECIEIQHENINVIIPNVDFISKYTLDYYSFGKIKYIIIGNHITVYNHHDIKSRIIIFDLPLILKLCKSDTIVYLKNINPKSVSWATKEINKSKVKIIVLDEDFKLSYHINFENIELLVQPYNDYDSDKFPNLRYFMYGLLNVNLQTGKRSNISILYDEHTEQTQRFNFSYDDYEKLYGAISEHTNLI